jgi:hypothetical protein
MLSLPIIILLSSLIITFTIAYFQGNGMTRERALIAYLVSTGFSMIFGGIGHIFFPAMVAKQISWKVAPQFQFEIGIANIAFGILSLLTFFYRKEFILSTIIATTIWGWGNSIVHILSYLKDKNVSPGNTGWALYLDLLFPLISIFLYKNVYNKYI